MESKKIQEQSYCDKMKFGSHHCLRRDIIGGVKFRRNTIISVKYVVYVCLYNCFTIWSDVSLEACNVQFEIITKTNISCPKENSQL